MILFIINVKQVKRFLIRVMIIMIIYSDVFMYFKFEFSDVIFDVVDIFDLEKFIVDCCWSGNE